MESRSQRIFLNRLLAIFLCIAFASSVQAEDEPTENSTPENASAAGDASSAGQGFGGLLDPNAEEPLVNPEVERREMREVKIDSENIEAGLYAGVLSIEDFGSDFVVGGMMAWHFTEDLFLQAHYYQSEAGMSSYETLSGNALLLDDRAYTGYDLSVGYNVFPGEAFIGRKRAYNTAFYLLAGIGSTEFGGDDHLTLNLGVGYRLLLNDWLAWHVGFRDHVFSSDITGQDKQTHNMEMTTGLTTFF